MISIEIIRSISTNGILNADYSIQIGIRGITHDGDGALMAGLDGLTNLGKGQAECILLNYETGEIQLKNSCPSFKGICKGPLGNQLNYGKNYPIMTNILLVNGPKWKVMDQALNPQLSVSAGKLLPYPTNFDAQGNVHFERVPSLVGQNDDTFDLFLEFPRHVVLSGFELATLMSMSVEAFQVAYSPTDLVRPNLYTEVDHDGLPLVLLLYWANICYFSLFKFFIIRLLK